MIESAGVLIISDGKILLCHSTDVEGLDSGKEINYEHTRWGIPKGKIDGNESSKDAAYREVHEETGLDLKKLGFNISNSPIDVLHYHSMGEKKIVYVYYLSDEFGMLRTKKLHCKSLIDGTKYPENDKFRWVSNEEAKSLIYRSQLKLLSKI